MDNNLMYMGVGIVIALIAVYILRRIRSFIFFVALLIVASSVFSIGPINHARTSAVKDNIAQNYQGASDFKVDIAENGGSFNVNGQNYQFKMADGFKSVVIMQDGQEVNKIDVSNTVNDIKDKAKENGIIDKVKNGIKSGIDTLKSIAPSDTKWPSDYMQEQTEQSTEISKLMRKDADLSEKHLNELIKLGVFISMTCQELLDEE